MQLQSFGRAALAGLFLAGLSVQTSADTATTQPSEIVCRASFGAARILARDGHELTGAEINWAQDISSEEELINCEAPPTSLVLKSHVMFFEDGEGEGLQMAEQVAAYLKQTHSPQTFVTWVEPLYTGQYGKVAGKTALYWLEYGAQIGDPVAINELGGVYELGAFHIARDMETAMRLERQAADLGLPVAMFSQGVRYFQGAGVRADQDEGMRWIMRSAEHGYIDAVRFLAWAYDGSEEGAQYGVKPNRKKAHRWAKIGAENGDTKMMALYASLLLRDPKSLRHEDEVFYWLDRAVAAGDEEVETILAQVGPDLRRNYREAREARDATKDARRDEIMQSLFKQCPRVQRCVVFQNRNGQEFGRNCGSYPDFTNCG